MLITHKLLRAIHLLGIEMDRTVSLMAIVLEFVTQALHVSHSVTKMFQITEL